jgi:hypothetical protein
MRCDFGRRKETADVSLWPLAAAPAAEIRGSFRGESGHATLTVPRQFMTDTVEKGVALIGEQ